MDMGYIPIQESISGALRAIEHRHVLLKPMLNTHTDRKGLNKYAEHTHR